MRLAPSLPANTSSSRNLTSARGKSDAPLQSVASAKVRKCAPLARAEQSFTMEADRPTPDFEDGLDACVCFSSQAGFGPNDL